MLALFYIDKLQNYLVKLILTVKNFAVLLCVQYRFNVFTIEIVIFIHGDLEIFLFDWINSIILIIACLDLKLFNY